MLKTHKIERWRQSQWPCRLRLQFAAACLLELRVSIPPGAWILSVVNVVCCQVEVSVMGQLLVERVPNDCECECVSVSSSVIRCNNNPSTTMIRQKEARLRKKKKERTKMTAQIANTEKLSIHCRW